MKGGILKFLPIAGWNLIIAIMALASGPAMAACPGEPHEKNIVTRVLDGETLVLADLRQVVLINAAAVKLPLAAPQKSNQALVDAARTALARLVVGKEIILRYGGRRKDRYGRILAQVYLSGGQWVQGAMVSQGFARVYSFHDNQACVGELMVRERRAREARAGLWRLAHYRVKSALKIKQLRAVPNSFQVVEGRVRKYARVARRVFLNFGDDWKRDFTVTIAPGAVRRFAKARFDLKALEGQKIRVRGWIELRNGPSMEVTHPGQIEKLMPAIR